MSVARVKLLPDENLSPRVAEVLGRAYDEDRIRLARVAVAALTAIGDLVNTVLWIAADGSARVEDIPPP